MPQKALLEALLARLRLPLYVGMDGGLQRARECVTFSETSKKPSLTWQLYVYAKQGRRNTFYFGGGANFSYQNMDVASKRFTSVARKLLGGLPNPHGSYTYAQTSSDPRCNRYTLLWYKLLSVMHTHR